jgi:hypothetical protein
VHAQEFAYEVQALPDDRTSGLVEVWFGEGTFIAVAVLAPFFTLLLPLQSGWVRWIAAGIDARIAVLGLVLTIGDATTGGLAGWRLCFGLAVCTTLLAIAVLQVVRRVGSAALVLAVVTDVAAVLQVAALLDLQAAVGRGPIEAPASTGTGLASAGAATLARGHRVRSYSHRLRGRRTTPP